MHYGSRIFPLLMTVGLSLSSPIVCAQYMPSGLCVGLATLPNRLQIEDRVTGTGPHIADAQLVALENGRKAVMFTVHSDNATAKEAYWGIRYSVVWQDECGRLLSDTSASVDGFVLNPNDTKVVRIIGHDKTAARAILKIYLE